MSESAGRRRKDNAGNVIIFTKHLLPTLKEITEIAFGKPAALQSQFYLTYWMLLNWISISKDNQREVSQSFGKVDFFNLSTQADKTKSIQREEKPTACPTPRLRPHGVRRTAEGGVCA